MRQRHALRHTPRLRQKLSGPPLEAGGGDGPYSEACLYCRVTLATKHTSGELRRTTMSASASGGQSPIPLSLACRAGGRQEGGGARHEQASEGSELRGVSGH